MKKVSTRISVLLTASILYFSAASCSTQKNGDSSSGITTAITVSQTMYKEERLSLPDDFGTVITTGYVDETGKILLLYSNIDGNTRLSVINSDFKEESNIALTENEEIHMQKAEIRPDGSINLLLMFVSYDKPEITDVDDYYKNAEKSFEIRCFSPSGELSESISVNELSECYSLETSRINSFSSYGDGAFLLDFSDGRAVIDKNGSLTDVKEISDDYLLGADSEGNIIAASYDDYCYLDGSSLNIPQKKIEFSDSLRRTGAPFPGTGDFTVYLPMNEGIFGLTENGTLLKLLDFTDSDIASQEIYSLSPAGEGRFLLIGSGDTGYYMSKLTVRPDNYTENKETVILAELYSAEEDIRSTVTQFNKFNDNYKIEIKTYPDGNEELRNDILTDNAPDIYHYKNNEDMYKFANLGALTDMYELMEKYGGFTENNVMDNVLEALRYKDGLYAVSDRFFPEIYFANNNVISSEYNNWTYDEMFEFAGNMPENMYFGNKFTFSTRKDIFNYLCGYNYSSWIDYAAATCYFDSDEFIELLEFSLDIPILPDRTEQYGQDSDAALIMQQEDYNMLKNKTALIYYPFITTLDAFVPTCTAIGMSMDELTFVGYPSRDGKGQIYIEDYFSVITNGKCTEGAWQFINYIMSSQYQENITGNTFGYFMTRKDSFEKVTRTYQRQSRNSKYFDIDNNLRPAEISDDALNRVYDVIDSSTVLRKTDQTVFSILSEEYDRLLNGEISAEECAIAIQNRISIYLSETA